MSTPNDWIARAIHANFTSTNVEDSNGEAANVVDALDRIGHSIYHLAEVIESGLNLSVRVWTDDDTPVQVTMSAVVQLEGE